MAQIGLHPQSQLAKRSVVLDDLEQWIVAEALGAAGFEEDSPVTAGLAFRADRAAGISDGDVADELRRAPLPRDPIQLLQEQAIVRLVRGVGAGKAGRVDTRPACQGIDRDAAVVGQHPAAELPGIAGGLQSGVGRKGVAILDHFANAGKVGQRTQRNARRTEQIRQFDSLVTISCTENEHGSARIGGRNGWGRTTHCSGGIAERVAGGRARPAAFPFPSRCRTFRCVEIRIHRRVVVHLELAIDLQPFAAGEKVVQQFAKRLAKIEVLLVQDFQPGLGLGDVAIGGVAAAGLLFHVVEPQCQNRQPVDHAAGGFRVQTGIGARPDRRQRFDQVVIQPLDQVVALLIELVDRPLDIRQIGIACHGAAGNVFLVPEAKVLLVLKANNPEEPLIQIVYLVPVPSAGTMKIVLTWENAPNDLEANLWMPKNCNSPNGCLVNEEAGHTGSLTTDPPEANMDTPGGTRITAGFGPEAISVVESPNGNKSTYPYNMYYPNTYTYAVHINTSLGTFSQANAVVTVYDGPIITYMKVFNVPTGSSGKWWKVFTIDGATRKITTVNQVLNYNPQPYVAP